MIIQSHLYDRVYVFTPQMVAYHCLEMLIEVSQHSLSHHVKLECLLCLRRTWDNTAALLHWELQGIPSPLSLCLSDKEIILHNYRTKQQDYLHSGNKRSIALKQLNRCGGWNQRVNRALITPEKQCLQIMNSHLVQFNSILIESNKTLPFHFLWNCIPQNTAGGGRGRWGELQRQINK